MKEKAEGKAVTYKDVAKSIKGLSVGRDKKEIMWRVSRLLGSPIGREYFETIIDEYLSLEEYYHIGVASRKISEKEI